MSVSGLTEPQRQVCRELAVNAMELVLHHAAAVHYTEGDQRWQGLHKGLIAARGEFPTEGDCSSTVTWAEAQGLHFRFKHDDLVNGESWQGGYTGTIAPDEAHRRASQGRVVLHRKNILRADLQLYGTAYPWAHVAMLVGVATSGQYKGEQMVISHGSEGGPYYLPAAYRSDLGPVIRVI